MNSGNASIRLLFFAGTFALITIWEALAPRRPPTVFRAFRWFNNLGLAAIGALLPWLLLPVLAVDAAFLSETRRWGLLNQVNWHFWLKFILAFLALDLAIYIQHVLFHKVPVLWRLHKVHHTDLDVDVSTAVRFHPLEILLSMLFKVAVVAALGAHFLAVIAFEIALNATSLFNHGNARMPGRLDAFLRLIIVTPDMHRVHHSVLAVETDSNFGFNLPWWDRLFGTYTHGPRLGPDRLTLGLPAYRVGLRQTFSWLLALPFLRKQ